MAFPLYLIKSLCEKTVCSIFQFIQSPLFCANSFLLLLNLSYHDGTYSQHKYPSLLILNPFYVVCTCLLDPLGPAQPTLYGGHFLVCMLILYSLGLYIPRPACVPPKGLLLCSGSQSLHTTTARASWFPPHFGSSSWIFLCISSGKSADYG